MPKLWNETIEAHRRDVREAVIDAAAALVLEEGLFAVTMSRIAEETGIGRATLYKYFPDVQSILLAWHDRQLSAHMTHLAEARNQSGSARERLEAVLQQYALITHGSRGHQESEVVALLHGDERLARAQQELREFIRDLIADAAASGDVRDDVSPDELVDYCLHALNAARIMPSKPAVYRLVSVTLAGLRPIDAVDSRS